MHYWGEECRLIRSLAVPEGFCLAEQAAILCVVEGLGCVFCWGYMLNKMCRWGGRWARLDRGVLMSKRDIFEEGGFVFSCGG